MTESVLVAFCSGDLVHADFASSLALMMVYSDQKGVPVDLSNARSSVIAHGRSMAAQDALDSGAGYLLFLDSDLTFPQDTLVRLLAHNELVAGATYRRRTDPHGWVHHELEGLPAVIEPGFDGARRVAALPTGCLLIRTAVFRACKPPYFTFGAPHEGFHTQEGEDVGFCRGVRKLGFSIWMDCGLSQEIGHIGTYTHRMIDKLAR